MLKTIIKLTAILLLGVVAAGAFHPLLTVHAAINSCSVTASPSSVAPGSNAGVTLTVTNSSSAAIQYLSIKVPTGNFYYTGNSINGWVSGNPGDGSGVVLNGSSLNPGQSEDFPISANTAVSNESSSNWTVSASDDPDGANPTTCTGSAGTAIAGHLPNSTDNGVSNIAVSNITASSVTVSWDSNVDTSSLVYYGKTLSYSSWSTHDRTPTSGHSVNLTGLASGTAYHFQVAGQDDSFNPYYSADGTFLTSGSAAGGNTQVEPLYTPIPIKAVATEHIPPSISLSTSFTQPYKVAPIINGVAADNEALAGIEYSTDGGLNWLPADKAKGLGGKSANFSFTPQGLEDGNYPLLARAIDTSGNIGTTTPATLVIDRLPPLVGGNVINVGPQVMQPGSDGTITALQGVDQKITLSAVGGPISILLVATATGDNGKAYVQRFNLTASEESGLWSGVLGFTKAGVYTLTANAVDGAGNKTSRVLGKVNVSSSGRTIDSDIKQAVPSTVAVYYQEPESHTWVLWDGAAFGQRNPQKTNRSGKFSLFLPAGKYYLKATAPGYHTLISSIIHATQPTPVTANLELRQLHGPHLAGHYLTWPSLGVQRLTFAKQLSSASQLNALVGRQVPDFNLTDTTGASVRTIDLLGRPTLISFNATWAPGAAEQLGALSKLQANSDFNILPVALQEGRGRVQAYTDIANVKLKWLVDPDSTLSINYNVLSLPMHYFVDRKGVVRQVVVGVLTEKQLTDRLAGL